MSILNHVHRKWTRIFLVWLIVTLFLTSSAFAAPSAPEVATIPSIIKDPGFETSYGSETYWGQTSYNFESPLCTAAGCQNTGGTAGPHSGSVWARFGGVDFTDPESVSPESASVYQYVKLPNCGAVLTFYFWIGAAAPGSDGGDYFYVNLNSTTLFFKSALQKNDYPGYTLVTVDIKPGTFPPNESALLTFSSMTSDQTVTFNLDDITLTPKCYSILGKVGSVEGVKIDYTGGSTTTAHNGSYFIDVPPGWSGTVTPSLAGYTFSPPSRTYTNVTADQTNQNYTPTATRYPITGSVGLGDVSLSYYEWGAVKTVKSQPDGKYSIPVPHGWSGTITPIHACFTFNPTKRSYTAVTALQPDQNYTATFIPGSGCADIRIAVGGAEQARYSLAPQESTRTSFPGLNNGPVKFTSTNAVPILAAERVIYKAAGGSNVSFSEMMGLPNKQLDTTYWLPWYNNKDLDTQLRFANVSSSTATVHVYIGGKEMTGSPFNLLAGASTRKSFPGINAGPVKIESNVNIVAAERLIYKVGGNLGASFSEMMALPNSQLDTTYWLPWYNNKDLDTQLRIANVSDATATVHVYIGGAEMQGSPFTLLKGESTRKSFAGVNNGPVKIESNVNIVAAERVIYKAAGAVDTSFTEMMALPNKQLNTTYWLPWYNNKDLDTQLRFANVSNSSATVHVYIGGVEMMGSPFPLASGASTRKSFTNVNDGPVRIVSTQNIVVAERVIYKVNNIATSFSEMMGLPESQLDTIYWLPWYNNADLDTQLRFGTP